MGKLVFDSPIISCSCSTPSIVSSLQDLQAEQELMVPGTKNRGKELFLLEQLSAADEALHSLN